jgi:hypothetical protein
MEEYIMASDAQHTTSSDLQNGQQIKPYICDVCINVHTLPQDTKHVGSAELRFDSSGISLIPKKKKGYRDMEEAVTSCWKDVRELKNKIRERKRFKANFSFCTPDNRTERITLEVVLLTNSHETINMIAEKFDRLPDSVTAHRCPKCSGPVSHDKCSSCGTSYTTHYRKRGLRNLLVGIGFLTLSAVATVISYNVAVVAEFKYFLILGYAPGILYFLFGALGILTGRRLWVKD